MPGVTIIIDANSLLPTQKATYTVEKVGDYAYAYLTLREAIHQKSSITIHVRNRTVATWFTNISTRYGDTHIALRTYTPRDALAEQWQIALPPHVTNQDILQSRLLDAQVTPRTGQDFWDALLEHFYGSTFTYNIFPSGKLADLLNTFQESHWQNAVQRPLVIQAQRQRLEHWARTANSDAVRTIVQRLAKEPTLLRRDLIHYKLLQNYPSSLSVKVLGDAWEIFKKVPMDLEDLHHTAEDTRLALTEIEYYLTEQQKHIASTDDIQRLLEMMSGHIQAEFDHVEQIALAHPEYLTPALLQQIEQRFRPIKTTIEHILIKMRRMLRPEYPQVPQTFWEVSEWLNWIINSYMPYYSWLDAQARREPAIANYAFMFADWFYDHFIEIKNGMPQHFAFNALYQERERMLQEQAISLIVIVDNLNFTYFDELKQQFYQQDFALEEVRPVLSLLPTATDVCKAALIAGQGDQMDFYNARYSNLVTDTWNPLLQGKKAKYWHNIGELQKERNFDPDCSLYFLNYLPIDEALHKDDRDSGRTHAEEIHGYLASLAKDIATFAKRFQIENCLTVYIISDHGSTRIPQDIVNVIDKKFFKGLTLEAHHRFIPLADDKFAGLQQVAESQCYLLDRHTFKTNNNYLIARQYYRFKETQENFYIHGGLTPEEVVVPFARFTRKPVTPLPPTLRLLTSEFRYAVKSKVLLELGNPNAFPLEALSVRLVDAEADEVFLTTIAPKHVMLVELLTIFRKTPGSTKTRTLTLRVRYECQGHQFTAPDQTFEITMKTIMEVPDDGFDF